VVDGEARTASRFRTRGHCPVDGLYLYYTQFGLNCNVYSSLHMDKAVQILLIRSIGYHRALRGHRMEIETTDIAWLSLPLAMFPVQNDANYNNVLSFETP